MDNETQTWLTQANTALIRYPRFKALHQDMRECQELSRLSNEPCCLSLEGVTGAGKSTLVRDYAALFPRMEESTGTRVSKAWPRRCWRNWAIQPPITVLCGQ
jgi:putative protein kinase ArgK-like GTPase of G3E family